MSPRHSIGILLAAISFASAQDLPHPTRLLTNPVQPPGFSDDPALTTPRPLLIITPPEVIYGDPGSTSDNTLTPETTIPYQDELPLETDGPIEATITTTTTITPEVPSTSSSPFVTSTSFPPTPLPTAAITTTSSTTSSTTTTATAATEATTDDAEAQVAATSVDLSPLPFIDSRFEKRSAVSSMANPASMPTAFTSAAAGLIAIVGLAMAL